MAICGGDPNATANYYCAASYNKDSDDFTVIHTDNSGSRVTRANTVSFEKSSNVFGFDWRVESVEVDETHQTLY